MGWLGVSAILAGLLLVYCRANGALWTVVTGLFVVVFAAFAQTDAIPTALIVVLYVERIIAVDDFAQDFGRSEAMCKTTGPGDDRAAA
jgi:hypothetical protein